jgi:hypothetical protein
MNALPLILSITAGGFALYAAISQFIQLERLRDKMHRDFLRRQRAE